MASILLNGSVPASKSHQGGSGRRGGAPGLHGRASGGTEWRAGAAAGARVCRRGGEESRERGEGDGERKKGQGGIMASIGISRRPPWCPEQAGGGESTPREPPRRSSYLNEEDNRLFAKSPGHLRCL
jgi:hypothetical protein